LQRHKVSESCNLWFYGRWQTYTDESDVDILVELDDSYSLLDFIGIGRKLDLEEALNRSVDLVEYRALKPAFEKYIFENPIPIYG
jgi:predicted nucleotidyltransferase